MTGNGGLHVATQCGVFKGTTKTVFVDRREYTGPIWEQIDEAFQFVLRNIHLGATIVGIYRQDVYEIPPDAIRELIINAMVHRRARAVLLNMVKDGYLRKEGAARSTIYVKNTEGG